MTTPADAARHRALAGPRPRSELMRFFEHLEEELDRNGFLRNAREATEHGAQPAQPVPARPMHRAGAAHPPRRRHRLRRAAAEGGAAVVARIDGSGPAPLIVRAPLPKNAAALRPARPACQGPGETIGTTTMGRTMSVNREGSKYKINRRLGVNLWGRSKSPLNHSRDYGPGQHGQRRKKPSDFGTQLHGQAEAQGLLRQYRRAPVPPHLRGGARGARATPART